MAHSIQGSEREAALLADVDALAQMAETGEAESVTARDLFAQIVVEVNALIDACDREAAMRDLVAV